MDGTSSQLSDLYAALREGSYDGVDRVVLNAYFGNGADSRRLSDLVGGNVRFR